jgi:hypothetical protein
VSGTVPLTVASVTFVSQVVNSPTLVTVTLSGAVTGKAYSMPANAENITGQRGEGTAALGGTFS